MKGGSKQGKGRGFQRRSSEAMKAAFAIAKLPKRERGQRLRALGMSASRYRNFARLLGLPRDPLSLIIAGLLTPKHGEVLLRLPTAALQTKFAHEANRDGISATELARRVDAVLGIPRPTTSARLQQPSSMDPNVRALAERLAAHVGSPTSIAHLRDGSGTISIQYHSLEIMEGILERIGVRFE